MDHCSRTSRHGSTTSLNNRKIHNITTNYPRSLPLCSESQPRRACHKAIKCHLKKQEPVTHVAMKINIASATLIMNNTEPSITEIHLAQGASIKITRTINQTIITITQELLLLVEPLKKVSNSWRNSSLLTMNCFQPIWNVQKLQKIN